MDEAGSAEGGGGISPGSEGVVSGPNVAGLGEALEAPPEIVDLTVSHQMICFIIAWSKYGVNTCNMKANGMWAACITSHTSTPERNLWTLLT
jgi:hypothetical protein